MGRRLDIIESQQLKKCAFKRVIKREYTYLLWWTSSCINVTIQFSNYKKSKVIDTMKNGTFKTWSKRQQHIWMKDWPLTCQSRERYSGAGCINLLHRLKKDFAAMKGGLKEKADHAQATWSSVPLYHHIPYKHRQSHGTQGTTEKRFVICTAGLRKSKMFYESEDGLVEQNIRKRDRNGGRRNTSF